MLPGVIYRFIVGLLYQLIAASAGQARLETRSSIASMTRYKNRIIYLLTSSLQNTSIESQAIIA